MWNAKLDKQKHKRWKTKECEGYWSDVRCSSTGRHGDGRAFDSDTTTKPPMNTAQLVASGRNVTLSTTVTFERAVKFHISLLWCNAVFANKLIEQQKWYSLPRGGLVRLWGARQMLFIHDGCSEMHGFGLILITYSLRKSTEWGVHVLVELMQRNACLIRQFSVLQGGFFFLFTSTTVRP